jgi:pimeloyl-ACP methyl ester carboxylesterase
LDDWTLRISNRLQANVLAAEYSGFQNADVTPSESNLISDSLCAHDALCDHYGIRSEDLIVFGRSLGGGCAAAVAAERKTKTLILDRTFDSVANVAADKFPIFPIRFIMRNQFDSLQRLRRYKGRVIQIHGTTDEVVPIEHGQRLYDSIPASAKVFLKVPGMYHNDSIPSKTLDEVRRLLSEQDGEAASGS